MAEPGFREPMLATLSDEVPTGDEWVFEAKLDGVRLIVERDGDSLRLWTRNHKDRTERYGELVGPLMESTPPRFVADGEVVAGDGRLSSFERLQRDSGRAELHLYLFDLLHLDGDDLEPLPLRKRKQALREVVDFGGPIRFCTHRNQPERGASELLASACEKGFEGLIAKRGDGTYVHGRSRDWLKLKCVARQEFLICGFTEPSGSRSGLGALLVGYHEDGAVRYAGRVGTGFDDDELARLRGLLEPLVTTEMPFAQAPDRRPGGEVHWVDPRLVCEVGFTEWTSAGRLRHPRYLGLRDDKDPADVVRERPAGKR